MSAAKWERRGECNHCGYCCEFIGHKIFVFTPQPPTGATEVDRHFFAVRGIDLVAAGARAALRVDLFTPCKVYDRAARRCAIYAQRPVTCQLYPELPTQIVGTPCSYWFERQVAGQVERVGGNGAPPEIPRNFLEGGANGDRVDPGR